MSSSSSLNSIFLRRRNAPSAATTSSSSFPSPRRKLKKPSTPTPTVPFLRQWDPSNAPPPSPPPSAPTTTSPTARSLSPIARFVLSSLHRNNLRWGPPVIRDLSTLRRLPASILAELLRSPLLPTSLSTPLFHWASRQPSFRPSYSSFNALILHHLPISHSLLHLPDLMLRLHLPPTPKQFHLLLLRLHHRHPHHLHRLYLRMLHSFQLNPPISLHNRFFSSLLLSRRLDLALDAYHNHFLPLGNIEQKSTFIILARGLSRDGRLDEAFQLLSKMKNISGCDPDVFAYTAIAKSLISGGHPSLSLTLWEEAERRGVSMDPMACTTIVSALSSSGRPDDARRILRSARQRGVLLDRAAYAALIEGFARSGRVGDACEIYGDMSRLGYRADLPIYDSLISALCTAGKEDKAAKLLDFAAQDGLVPGPRTVCHLLAFHAIRREIDDLLRFLQRIARLGSPLPDCVAMLLKELFSNGDEEKALLGVEIFEELKKRRGGGYCNVSTCNLVIELLHEVKMPDRALALFAEMKTTGSGDSSDLRPESSTYSSIIPCFVESGDVRGACSLYSEMKERGWIPSIGAYRWLVKGLCNLGEVDAAITLVKDCLGNVEGGPGEFKYALTVIDACRSGDPQKVIGVVDEMMEDLSCPTEEDVIYCAIIYGFCKYSRMKGARSVLSDLRNREILTESKLIKYEDILKEHAMRTTAGLVISGLKFFGVDKKKEIKLSGPLEYSR